MMKRRKQNKTEWIGTVIQRIFNKTRTTEEKSEPE
jgi:hypothetical protein